MILTNQSHGFAWEGNTTRWAFEKVEEEQLNCNPVERLAGSDIRLAALAHVD